MRLPYALEQREDEEIEDLLRHERRRERDEPLTTRNSEWRVGLRIDNDVEIYHESRSERAQTVDENHNAPLPDTLGQWANNPNRYDLPGVDTIPEDVEKDRAESFAESQQERGAVGTIRTVETGEVMDRPDKLANAAFDGHENEIRLSEAKKDDPFVLAHEAGHAADAFATPKETTTKRGYEFDELFDDEQRKERVGEQLTTLSNRARGDVEKGDKRYRDSPNEKIADAAALSVVEPRAAKREAPDAVDFLEETGILKF